MVEPVVSVRGLTYSYRGQREPALKGVNLEVAEGEFVVVMGPSGAGKSTLCVSLNGLIPHFFRGRMEGEVRIEGHSTREGRVGEFAKEVGLVFQDFEAQLFSTNVALEVAFGPENFQVDREEMARRVKSVLGRVRLEGFEGRQPATLSGGQKQRLAIASVLAIEPRILCLDEPTTDLDPIGKLGVFEIAEELKDRDDVTLIVVEHETEETLDADRIVVLRDGKIVADRPAREILRDVELLEQSRVMPLQVARFFHEMGLWQGQLPLTPKEGLEEFKRRNWRVSPERHRELVEADELREEGYGEPLIEVEGLTHRYPNGVVALEGADLTVRQGEFLAVLGQNGSGKTTLVKHFNGLLEPTEGSVRVHGEETVKQGVRRLGQRVGYVFQNPDHQIFSDTVFDEVAFGPKIRDLEEDEVKERVSEALTAVGLEGYEEEDPFGLTKGERQRVAVASVLAVRPEVLILDEPTTGLDYAEQRSMMDLVRRLNEAGSTIIVVTHTMWVVAEYAHRAAVIKDGKMVPSGTVREVFVKEEELRDASLRPPHIVSLGNALGFTVLSVEEMLRVTEGE
ncbi:MAG: energy-coupling factor transporter ATPase [Actinomycetota bacterium]|jgi:cobalt transport protein ATP-binding subunit|nr:energy-coupling factor transporter ATPase [Actinomycetota bacterium]